VQYNNFGLPAVLDWSNGQGQFRRTQFTYDPDGSRVIKRDDEQTSITVAGLFERRAPAGTSVSQVHNLHNIIVGGRVIAQVNRAQAVSGGPVIASQVTYLHADLQGSTVALTNRNGEPSSEDSWLREHFYDPFGRQINAQNEPVEGDSRRGGPRQGYTGHDHDAEYGLINMKGRIYDPEARRFLTPDPILQDPVASQGRNRYTYVWNNPTTFIDPTGWQGCEPENASCAPDWDWLSGSQSGSAGEGVSEDYLFGSNVITPDGVDDDVTWPEDGIAEQLAEEPYSTLAIGQGIRSAWPSSKSPVVFWSGYPAAMLRAAKVAAAGGGSTIAGTWEGRLLDWLYSKPALRNSEIGQAVIDTANKLGSAVFAFGAGAAGRPKLSVIRAPENPASIRRTVELRAYGLGRVARVGVNGLNLLTALPAIDELRAAISGVGEQIDIEGLDPGDYCVGCFTSVVVGYSAQWGVPIELHLVVERNVIFRKKFYVAPDPCTRPRGC
jgi:RHS repeat-associated protein